MENHGAKLHWRNALSLFCNFNGGMNWLTSEQARQDESSLI